MGNKDKNKDQCDSAAVTEGALGDSTTSPRDACHANRDLSWEREARDATLAKQVVEAIAREMAKAHMHYQALLNERGAAAMPTSLKMNTGADVNCMNEKTFNELFPEVQLSVCPHEIQNFGNSVADISILGQFCTYFEFKGEKYLNIFIVTNANDCSNLLSYGATFRMGVLLPNYPEENVVKGDNVPNFSKVNEGRTGNGTAHSTSHSTQHGISYANKGNSTGNGTLDRTDCTSNIFQILNNIQKRQRAIQCQYNSSMVPTVPEMETPFRTTTPSAPATTAKQVDSVHVHALPVQNTSWSGPPAHCAHVHKLPKQVFKPGDSLALRKVQHPHNGRTSVNRLALMKQDIRCHIIPVALKV